jgi:hypothetical protein
VEQLERERDKREICGNSTKILKTKCIFSVLKKLVNIGGSSSWTLEDGPICCPETSLTHHQSMLRNIPEEKIFHLHGDRSIKLNRAVNIITIGR